MLTLAQKRYQRQNTRYTTKNMQNVKKLLPAIHPAQLTVFSVRSRAVDMRPLPRLVIVLVATAVAPHFRVRLDVRGQFVPQVLHVTPEFLDENHLRHVLQFVSRQSQNIIQYDDYTVGHPTMAQFSRWHSSLDGNVFYAQRIVVFYADDRCKLLRWTTRAAVYIALISQCGNVAKNATWDARYEKKYVLRHTRDKKDTRDEKKIRLNDTR